MSDSARGNVRDFPSPLRITCLRFFRMERGKLKGFCDLEVGAWNLILRDCKLFESDHGDFIALPTAPFEGRDGQKQWKKLVELTGKQANHDFQEAALAAIAKFARS